jgi:predicted dehydrogenase
MKNRREFMKSTTLAAGTLLLPKFTFGSLADKVTLAVAGVNSRGHYLAKMLARIPDVEVAYICDVDSNAMEKTIAEVAAVSGKRPKGVSDMRKLVELKDLDAIAMATPDHWHAPGALMAVKAGKHVYLEKPCSHNPAEGEMLVKASEKYGKLVQLGTQRRSFPGVTNAIQELKSGGIGRVYFAKGWYSNARKSIGKGKEAPVPAHLDFDLWQGPAPRRPYRDNLVHYNWHWFWHWGTGEALNNGTHEMDVMRWGLGVDYPTKVVSAGGRYAFTDDWETPDTQTITFEFSGGICMSWEGLSCNPYDSERSGRGVIFYGEKGTLVMPGGDDYKVFDLENKLVKEVKTTVGKADTTNTMGMGEQLDTLHLVNFLDTIRGKARLTAPIPEGHRSTLLAQLGNIAYRTGETLKTDPANGHILNSPEAVKLWAREYEKGWEMGV